MTKKTENKKTPWKSSGSGDRGANLTAEEKRAVKHLAEKATKKEKRRDEDRILRRLMKQVKGKTGRSRKKKSSSSSSVSDDSSDDDNSSDSDSSDD